MPVPRRPVKERFWEKVKKGPGCWEWIAGKDAKGYGRFQLGRDAGVKGAHIVSYEMEVGPVGDSWVLHRCDNPSCVRPDHLFLGDLKANNQDMFSKARSWQQARTNCPQGHPYDHENTYVTTIGERTCRACRRARRRKSPEELADGRERMGAPRRQRTHCVHGHEFTDENTRYYQGRRHCRACRRERSARKG